MARMSTQPFLPYARQSIDADDIAAASQAFAGDIITRGPKVEAFEAAIAEYCGARYGIAFNTGTAALIAACHAANVGPHDRLITTPNTFVASINAGMMRGAAPVFVDIDRNTGNLDIAQVGYNLEQRHSRGRNIILPVHFSGISVDVQKIEQKVLSGDDVIIEDAAHALGSRYPDGKMVGCCAWSHMTMFSFHPAKTITTGEGGMVMTNDPELAHRLRSVRNNCIERDPAFLQTPPPYDGYYEVTDMSCNYNFTEFQAALGLRQFQRIDQFIAKRRQLIQAYRDMLGKIPHVRMFTAEHDERTAFHLCVAQIDFSAYNTTRGHVVAQLKERNIGTQVHYIPIYRHPYISKNSGDLTPYFPEMEAYYAQALTLPLYYDLNIEDVERVVHTLQDVLQTAPKQPEALAKSDDLSRPHRRHHHVRQRKR